MDPSWPLRDKRALHNIRIRTEQKRNLESRAKDVRCIRTLTLILSLAGRGEENARGYAQLFCRERGKILSASLQDDTERFARISRKH